MWEDECWFSRFSQPSACSWAAGESLRLLERTPKSHTPEKALAAYGALREDNRQVYLHFHPGQPDTDATIDFLKRLLALARSLRKAYLVVIWDNASWHLSRKLRAWLKAYKQLAKLTRDVRLLVFYLPSKNPGSIPLSHTGFTPKGKPLNLPKRLCCPTNYAFVYSNISIRCL